MSTAELLTRLARLDARDRAWLLGELPPAMRRELATMLSGESQPESAAPAAATAPNVPAPGGWEALDAQRLATLFESEPAWLVSAATRGTEPAWRDRLLQAMGARRRHEIELADRSGGTFGARAAGCVLEGCRERLAAGVEPARGAPKQGFAALLDHMKGRFS
jgi:hypothetical protein